MADMTKTKTLSSSDPTNLRDRVFLRAHAGDSDQARVAAALRARDGQEADPMFAAAGDAGEGEPTPQRGRGAKRADDDGLEDKMAKAGV